MAEGKQELNGARFSFSQQAGLRGGEPAFGKEVIEEGMQAVLGGVCVGTDGYEMRDRWPGVGSIVLECVPVAGFFAQDPAIGIRVIDVAPQ